MKNAFFLCLLLSHITTFARPAITENQKLESLAKVWGFLKYYHPQVAKGKIDWDQELIQKMPLVTKAATPQELSQVYISWINQLGKVKRCGKCDNKQIADSLSLNLDLDWVYDSTLFTPELTQQLDYIRKNRNQKKNYYVNYLYPLFPGQAAFKNEKKYEGMEFPAEEYRLLGLFRYWNIINYFYPCKYTIDEDWNTVLADMLPKFRNAATPMEYHLAMLELIASIHDSHAWFNTKYTYRYFGLYRVPFRFKIIDNKAVVTGFYNDSLARLNDIRYGDVITHVEDKTVNEVLQPKLKYISASNYATQLRNASGVIFSGSTDSVRMTFERNGNIYTKSVKRYFPYLVANRNLQASKAQPWKWISKDIGYVNMDEISPKQVKIMMNEFRDIKAIIFDIRNYPKPIGHNVAAYLNKDKSTYANFTYPDLSYPGINKRKSAWKAGRKNNKNVYPGQAVLLFNEDTQSRAEFTCMALQSAPKVIGVGSQTAGAVGNITRIVFPGGYETTITGMGAYYPDGRPTQRIGIVPDIEVKPTIEGIRSGKDEVLERALQYLQTGK